MNATMTRAERQEIGVLIRKREKLLKSHAGERSAAMLAEFEAMSARIFCWDDHETWAKATAKVGEAVNAANAAIDEVCGNLGIPKEFRPSVDFAWRGRGENAVRERRAELRRVAQSRITAIEREAFVKIERMSLEAQTMVVAHGLESPAARKFFESMPDIQSLMPPLNLDEVQRLLVEDRQARLGRFY